VAPGTQPADRPAAPGAPDGVVPDVATDPVVAG
jgi:hypothetical protein